MYKIDPEKELLITLEKPFGYNEIFANSGIIILSDALIDSISLIGEYVFSRIRCEQQFAIEHNYTTPDGFFIFDSEAMSFHTGVSEDFLRNIIQNLVDRKLLDCKVVDDFELLKVEEREMTQAVMDLENYKKKYDYTDKYKLKYIQKKILKLDIYKKEENNDTKINATKQEI